MDVEKYLRLLVDEGVSDIHIKANCPPLKRVHGALLPTDMKPLTSEQTQEFAAAILGPARWKRFGEESESDTSFSIPGFTRFRISVFWQRGTVAMALRVIPFRVPTLDCLGVPAVAKELALAPRGLILVTGVTGSGKSSTLAGMIDHINHTKRCHVITIEDPIEFLHHDELASVNQREVGTDTRSFLRAFRSALRQDPDVILVGELRDAETMETAIRAAETGHLVLSTVHTTDAKETIGRFVDTFPPHQQKQVRLQLAANLRAVISQRLLERADRKGLVLAAEVMVVNAAIRDYIIDPDKIGEIIKNMEKGKTQYGMQSFDQAILDLMQRGIITSEEAIRHATSPNDFMVRMRLESHVPGAAKLPEKAAPVQTAPVPAPPPAPQTSPATPHMEAPRPRETPASSEVSPLVSRRIDETREFTVTKVEVKPAPVVETPSPPKKTRTPTQSSGPQKRDGDVAFIEDLQ